MIGCDAACFVAGTTADDLLRRMKERPVGQTVFPVLDASRKVVGIICSDDAICSRNNPN